MLPKKIINGTRRPDMVLRLGRLFAASKYYLVENPDPGHAGGGFIAGPPREPELDVGFDLDMLG